MKRTWGWSGGNSILISGLLLFSSVAQVSVGENTHALDACRSKAFREYHHMLKLCQLAENGNPRLRCYEAAKAAFLKALEECDRQ
jgi:hypothetical protein